MRLGVSTSLFAGPLSEADWALCAACGVQMIEVGYEQAGPALEQAGQREALVAVARGGRPPVFSLHAPYRPERDLSLHAEAVARGVEALDLALELGAGLVVVHASQEPIAPGRRRERLERARERLRALAEEACQRGLRLAVETMPPEWIPAGAEEILQVVEGLDPEVVGFCLDANHANLTGDLPALVRALGKRLWSAHISDNDGVRQRHWMPLRGIIDWGAFLGALEESGYTGPLFYELDPHPGGAEQGLREIAGNFALLQALR